jgi:hypothetical protein
MTFVRHLAVLITALLLTACAAPKLTQEQASNIKKIGIVSLLPQEVKYRKIGITVFNNEFKSMPAGDVFNVAARASAERYLRKSGKYEVKQIAVDVAPMAQRLNGREMVMSRAIERIDEEIAKLAKANGVDAVIVVGEYFHAERRVYGLAMSMRAGMGDVRSVEIGAGLQVAGVTADKSIFLGWSSWGNNAAIIPRPDGKPWAYKLEDNLDEGTHAEVVKSLQAAIASEVTAALAGSDL